MRLTDSLSPTDSWEPVLKQQECISTPLSEQVVNALEEILERRAATKTSTQGPKEPLPLVSTESLLRSNHHPSQEQVRFCNTIIAGITSEIMDIDHDILYLQLKVNRLMVEIKALDDSRVQKQKEAKYHAALLSPVRLLPLEILATIFHYAISVEPHGPGPRSNAAPFGVSHVCSSWRAAALSCPDLWNRLTLRPSHNPTAQNPWSYIFNTVMVSWFERAGPSLPLSLSFTCHVDKSNLDPDINREICQKITHFSPRFSELNIALDYCTALMPFLSLPGDSLPLLETLSFDNMKCHNDCSKITVFNAAPRLRAVTLHNIGSSDLIGDHPLSLPWSQLSYLEIEGKIRSEAFAAVLFQCTQIESASFARVDIDNLSDFADGASSADDAVTLARLATLKLAVEGPEDYGGINHVLEILKLPNLQTLTLVGDRRSDESQILSHMGHNVSRLRHLLLDAYRSPAEIVELIGKCVMLETLTIGRCNWRPDIVLNDLTHGPSLVHLASFTFTCSYKGNEDRDVVVDEFCDLVSSWMEDPSRQRPLESLSLYMHNVFEGDDADEVQAMLERTRTRIHGLEGYGGVGEVVFNTDVFETKEQLAQAVGL